MIVGRGGRVIGLGGVCTFSWEGKLGVSGERWGVRDVV